MDDRLLVYLTDDERELLRLAEAATPGEWAHADNCGITYCVNDEDYTIAYGGSSDDGAYIAAADPQTVLALLDALDVAEEAFKLLDKVNGAFVCPAVVDSRHCPHPETTSCIKPDNCGQRDTIGGECWHEWAYREARAAVAARQDATPSR